MYKFSPNYKSSIINRKSSGFTLVELLLVMALIGVLVTALIILINPVAQFQRGRDSQRKNDLTQLQRALEQYYNDFNSYPVSSGDPSYYILDSSHTWGTSWTPYMDFIPKDPISTQTYRYISTSQTYMIYAHLERGVQDAQVCNPDGNPATDDKCTGVPVGIMCGGVSDVCDYGVSSSNVSP